MQLEQFKKIIGTAIKAEVEAFEFYSAAAAKVEGASLKAIFNELAAEERQHKAFLEKLLTQVKPASLDAKQDYKVSESVEKPQLSVRMKPVDAIALAMKNEDEAMRMYTELAKASVERDQKDMFVSLAQMEQGHKIRLEAMYTDMAFVEAW